MEHIRLDPERAVELTIIERHPKCGQTGRVV